MRFVVCGRNVYAYTGSRAFDASRPTVMFVHGAAHDHGVFALQSRYFAWHGMNAVAVDLPAHGRSQGPALASVEAIADWLEAASDALGVERVHLVGHSMGALASLECAARHPQRVARLALLGVSAPMPVSEDLLAAAERSDHVAYELINDWSFSPGAKLGGNTAPGVWMLGNSLRLMERTADGVLANDLNACNQYANGVDAASRVTCPTLAIMGTRDIMAPPRNAKALLAALPDARVVTLPDAGHALMAERPDAVLDALREFFGSHTA
jgi:pimeloyl-ACP methyl ester carboxylesterase